MVGAGLHVAIVLDGNGRWAERRGLPRSAGHRSGALVVGRVVGAALDQGIGTLTLYAFSADNWRRPAHEVRALMSVFDGYLQSEVDRCVAHGIRLSVVGRRDRLPPALRRRVEVVEAATVGGRVLHLRLAIDYSGREAIWLAAERLICTGHRSREEFVSRIGSGRGAADEVPDVDLVIRTGGEQRLSDFLLWEAAYAELVFLSVPWPEFTAADLAGALAEFSRRERRFGGLEAQPQMVRHVS